MAFRDCLPLALLTNYENGVRDLLERVPSRRSSSLKRDAAASETRKSSPQIWSGVSGPGSTDFVSATETRPSKRICLEHPSQETQGHDGLKLLISKVCALMGASIIGDLKELTDTVL